MNTRAVEIALGGAWIAASTPVRMVATIITNTTADSQRYITRASRSGTLQRRAGARSGCSRTRNPRTKRRHRKRPVSTAAANRSCPVLPGNSTPSAAVMMIQTASTPRPSSTTRRPRLTSEARPRSGPVPDASRRRKTLSVLRKIGSAARDTPATTASSRKNWRTLRPPRLLSSRRLVMAARLEPRTGAPSKTCSALSTKAASWSATTLPAGEGGAGAGAGVAMAPSFFSLSATALLIASTIASN